MGEIVRRGRHRCYPDPDHFGRNGWTLGDVWQCDCGKQWIVCDTSNMFRRPSWRRKWIKVRTVEVEQ